jgi:hypothetical protein
MLCQIQSRMKEPFPADLLDTVHAQIKSGKLTEDMELSSVSDSSDRDREVAGVVQHAAPALDAH